MKIGFAVILQMRENKSGAGMDPHPVWTWWFFIYMLSSANLPLNVRIILSDPFSHGSSFMSLASVVIVVGQIRIAWRWLWRVLFFVFLTHFLLFALLFNWFMELLSFDQLYLFDGESDNDGSRYRSPGMCAFQFCSGKFVGSVGNPLVVSVA